MTRTPADRVAVALDGFRIELPSWGLTDSGTRFGAFHQPAAAVTLEDKFSDAGQVAGLTGVCPRLALHCRWDLPHGLDDVPEVRALAERFNVQAGSISPTLFQDPAYKFGSVASPDPAVRRRARAELAEAIAIATALGSRDIVVWLADGSNYPGAQSIADRIGWVEEAMREAHARLTPEQRLLIEYKPYEPATYHTDVADWGMALLLARHAGPRARVLVDTGHHYHAQNIEQIVAWLLHHGMLGGFHFNDRRYADDDLTLGSIDPYQVFRIFHEIHAGARRQAAPLDVAFMVDQSHNVKGKLEAMIQTVGAAQELYAKAALVDHDRLADLQRASATLEAEECLRDAFWTDVRPAVHAWRRAHGLPEDPLAAFRASGYLERITAERAAR